MAQTKPSPPAYNPTMTSSGYPVPPIAEVSQQSRATALWIAQRRSEALDAEMALDLGNEIAAVAQAKQALEKAKAHLLEVMPKHPKYQDLQGILHQLELLKGQFLNEYKAGDLKTIATQDGDKVQVRVAQKAVITNSRKTADILMQKDLWEAANVQLVIGNVDMLVPLVTNGVLKDAAVIEDKLSLAMLARKGA